MGGAAVLLVLVSALPVKLLSRQRGLTAGMVTAAIGTTTARTVRTKLLRVEMFSMKPGI